MPADEGTPPNGGVVLVSQRLGAPGEHERRIEQTGWSVLSGPLWSLDEIRSSAGGADLIMLGAVEPFDAAALESLPRCRGIVRRGVGYDNVDVDAATRLGIVVANVLDATVEEVSDHALALLLACERRIVQLDRALRAGAWQKDPALIQAVRAPMRRLSELTLAVLGFGRIGQALARKAMPLYAQVLAVDPIVSERVAAKVGVELVPLDEALGRADHFSLHLPRTPETVGLIGEAALARMKPGAVIVNTARGGVVDEVALRKAVEAGAVTAGLDVTEREPLPLEDPLMAVERIVLTGHSAAWSVTAQVELARRSVDAVIDLINGRPPASIVNRRVLTSPNLRIPELAADSVA